MRYYIGWAIVIVLGGGSLIAKWEIEDRRTVGEELR
jgi:hypothetical protein